MSRIVIVLRAGGSISNAPQVSPTAERLRSYLTHAPPIGPLLLPTILQLITWTESLYASSVISHLPATSATDPIEPLAEALVAPGNGIERQLLLKSIQEALFDFVGVDTKFTAGQLATRLKRCFDGKPAALLFIQQFLSLYFFNYVWFYTCEFFRADMVTPEAFEFEVEAVSGLCEKTVLEAFERVSALDATTLAALIQEIEGQLRGV